MRPASAAGVRQACGGHPPFLPRSFVLYACGALNVRRRVCQVSGAPIARGGAYVRACGTLLMRRCVLVALCACAAHSPAHNSTKAQTTQDFKQELFNHNGKSMLFSFRQNHALMQLLCENDSTSFFRVSRGSSRLDLACATSHLGKRQVSPRNHSRHRDSGYKSG